MIEKRTIYGKKGRTVCYSLPNLQIIGDLLTWEPFIYYAPPDVQFELPKRETDLTRDDTLDYAIEVYVTPQGDYFTQKIFEGALYEAVDIGSVGDLICWGSVPQSTSQEIEIYYKEVTNELKTEG